MDLQQVAPAPCEIAIGIIARSGRQGGLATAVGAAGAAMTCGEKPRKKPAGESASRLPRRDWLPQRASSCDALASRRASPTAGVTDYSTVLARARDPACDAVSSELAFWSLCSTLSTLHKLIQLLRPTLITLRVSCGAWCWILNKWTQ